MQQLVVLLGLFESVALIILLRGQLLFIVLMICIFLGLTQMDEFMYLLGWIIQNTDAICLEVVMYHRQVLVVVIIENKPAEAQVV